MSGASLTFFFLKQASILFSQCFFFLLGFAFMRVGLIGLWVWHLSEPLTRFSASLFFFFFLHIITALTASFLGRQRLVFCICILSPRISCFSSFRQSIQARCVQGGRKAYSFPSPTSLLSFFFYPRALGQEDGKLEGRKKKGHHGTKRRYPHILKEIRQHQFFI